MPGITLAAIPTCLWLKPFMRPKTPWQASTWRLIPILNYSLALRHELGAYGVNVTCVQPGYIRTQFDNNCGIVSEKYKKFSYKNGMSAYAVAKVAVASVFRKRSYVRAGVTNKIAAFVSGLVPKNFLAWCISKSMKSLTK